MAGNVIPDAASVTVNYRFAPDQSVAEALQHVHDVFNGLDMEIERTDAAAGALPVLTAPAAAALVQAAGGQVRAKYGWTDVSRFATRGIPAAGESGRAAATLVESRYRSGVARILKSMLSTSVRA